MKKDGKQVAPVNQGSSREKGLDLLKCKELAIEAINEIAGKHGIHVLVFKR